MPPGASLCLGTEDSPAPLQAFLLRVSELWLPRSGVCLGLTWERSRTPVWRKVLCKNIVDVMGGSKSHKHQPGQGLGVGRDQPQLFGQDIPRHREVGGSKKAFPFTPASKASPAVPEGSKGLITAPPPSPLPFPRSWGLLPVPQL